MIRSVVCSISCRWSSRQHGEVEEEPPLRQQLELVVELVLLLVPGLQASFPHSSPALGLALLCHPIAGSSST